MKNLGGFSTGHNAPRVELDLGYQDQQVFKGTFYELRVYWIKENFARKFFVEI